MSTSAEIVALHDNFGEHPGQGSSERVAQLLNAIPGITTLTHLVGIDPNRLSPSSRIDYLTALERQTAWLQALMQRT
jgi:hypothetical protein